MRPEAGRIVLDGVDLARVPPHRRPVNTMFQSYALFPHMSVAANIGFGLRQRGMPRAAIAARVAEMLALVRLRGLTAPAVRTNFPAASSSASRWPAAWRRGPRCCCWMNRCRRWTATCGATRARSWCGCNAQLGIAFILVTHDQEEALTMADRIGVMHAGRLAQVGTPAEVYERPAAGSSRSSWARRICCRSWCGMDGSSWRAAIGGPTGDSVAPDAAWLAIRPERVIDRRVGCGKSLAGVVMRALYAGETLTHLVRLADGSALRATGPATGPERGAWRMWRDGHAVVASGRCICCAMTAWYFDAHDRQPARRAVLARVALCRCGLAPLGVAADLLPWPLIVLVIALPVSRRQRAALCADAAIRRSCTSAPMHSR